jgi:hypothetical protein
MSQLLALMNQLHAIVGNRTAYVASFPGGYPGLVYFAADLRPAPYPIDLHTMIFTTKQRRQYMAAFRTSVLPHTQAVLTTHLITTEARDFLARDPDAKRIKLTFAGRPYYVLLSN